MARSRSQLANDIEARLALGSAQAAAQGGESSDETVVAENAPTVEKTTAAEVALPPWETDEHNPYNWSAGTKASLVGVASCTALLASAGTSIISAAHAQLMAEFGVTSTQAILPLSMYVFALALGPVVGGPLSETIGRYPVFLISIPLGALFTLGAALTPSFAGLCVCRFLAGFCFAPSLAISSGVLNEIYKPDRRCLPSTLYVLTPFLGPGLAPAIGAFATNRKGWRWTQYTMLFFSALTIALTLLFGRETFHPILKKRWAKKLGRPPLDPPVPFGQRLKQFLRTSLIRPLHMLATEPIVGLVCLYAACEFATLFTFFAAVPFVFQGVYQFSIEETGLVFLSIVTGCLLGAVTILLCDVYFYRRQIPRHPPHKVPPEYRLFPAMIGSIGPPVGLFWFAWTARPDVSWASPVVAMVPFAWGNLSIFVSTFQYMTDTYHGKVVASAASANSLARYGLAGAFPLFTIQMFSRLGINWAASLLAFIALALAPVP
ncbi:major facilitator superfamily transporter [Cercophora scortea]|uniref:Major facilitator superfamily transporter n=1 Tax=Cercophora scortea TaxID=314031 RepID=A0AAE0IZE9_9PEZI|nr:major facilitator superfamily transporter [Cercophora scortea]